MRMVSTEIEKFKIELNICNDPERWTEELTWDKEVCSFQTPEEVTRYIAKLSKRKYVGWTFINIFYICKDGSEVNFIPKGVRYPQWAGLKLYFDNGKLSIDYKWWL